MPARDLIVVGGSAGSIQALEQLVAGLPATLPAIVLVVIHTHPSSPGYLPRIIERYSALPCIYPDGSEPLAHGRIVIAPPDHHLVVEREHVRLTRGPKENRSRPAVDPLFRSAAYFHGSRVIGVILSGMLDDGTAGLWAVKDRGGLAVVQSPEDAQFPSMPESALRHVAIDYHAPARELGPLLARLVHEPAPVVDLPPVASSLASETQIAMEDDAMDKGVLRIGALSPFTCPECHGVMVQLREGGILRFRCHTGHAFSANSLLAELSESIEASLWSTMRSLQEGGMLLRHVARHLADTGDVSLAERFEARAAETERRAREIKRLAMGQEELGTD